MRVLSEESGWTGPDDAEITVVVDPVDGSTNCSRDIPYWAISLCALDADGPLVRAGRRTARPARATPRSAGEGAWLDGAPPHAVGDDRDSTASVVAIVGHAGARAPVAAVPRARLGALALCDVAAGSLDGYLDGLADQHRPWDYLGGLLVCREAGAVVVDVARPRARRSPTRTAAASWSPRGRPSCSTRCCDADRAVSRLDLDLDRLLDVAVDAAAAAGARSCATRSARARTSARRARATG